jgi:N-acetylmuramoyl-L-alanine amidase
MKRIAFLALSVPLLMAQSERESLLSVTAVRHWAVSDVTRVAIEISGEFSFRSDRLHNPERVYFDILHARPLFGTRRAYSQTVEDRLLKRVRVAETTPGVARVVLDLADGVELSSSQLGNPYRLIVELRAGAVPAAPAPAPAEVTALSPPAPAAPSVPKEPPAVVKTPSVVASAEQVTAEPSKAQLAKTRAAPLAEVGKAARRSSSGEISLTRTLGLKLARVVIDPGHGGHDQGTEGPRGLLEKDVVLDVSKRLGKLIESRMGAEVILTRSDDTFVPLEGRTALANEKKADLFLSVHANSSPAPRVAGIETFYLNITGAKDAMDVAARENASSQKSMFELADLIQTIARHDKAEESREFAGRIQAALYAFSVRNVAGSRNRGVKTAPFVVLIGAKMPSVLAEIGFLSNSREESLLKKADYRQKLAEALFRGVSRYAESLSHFQMALTSEPKVGAAIRETR